jgi:RNA polymerase sigma-70 factor, ECF subfamily
MNKAAPEAVNTAIEYTLRQDRGRLIAALVAAIGDFELAQECLQDATEKALRDWVEKGVPKSRLGWLLQVARRRAIDRLRRDKTFTHKAAQIAVLEHADANAPKDRHDIPDERLRLIFTCCHPALDQKTRVALTLRTLGGLTTAETARAFLDSTPTMAQRLSRARSKITKAGIPFVIPEGTELAPRLGSVLTVIYLIYNEGYGATEGPNQVRLDLCAEALFLARLMVELAPKAAEAKGLLALILFSMARRPARLSVQGEYIPLDEQDRGLWDQSLIVEARNALDQAIAMARRGPFQVQAAVSALHSDANQVEETDWAQISALYLGLYAMEPTPVVRLNHIIALSNVLGPEFAVDKLLGLQAQNTDMEDYQPFHAALADTYRRLGRFKQAITAYDRALGLSKIDSERAFLQARMLQCQQGLEDKKKAETSSALSPTGR